MRLTADKKTFKLHENKIFYNFAKNAVVIHVIYTSNIWQLARVDSAIGRANAFRVTDCGFEHQRILSEESLGNASTTLRKSNHYTSINHLIIQFFVPVVCHERFIQLMKLST